MLHFGRNLNFQNKSFQKLSYAVIFALIIQSFLPLVALANIRNQYQNAGLNDIIIICSGNELIYLKQSKNGEFTQIAKPDAIPLSSQTNHCDGCIFPNLAMPSADNNTYYIKLIESAKCPDIGTLPRLTFHNHLPPSRAPPA